MNIEQDGHLCLHLIDFDGYFSPFRSYYDESKLPDKSDKTVPITSFTSDARITAAYAWLAGHRVTCAIPGQPVLEVIDNEPTYRFEKAKQ